MGKVDFEPIAGIRDGGWVRKIDDGSVPLLGPDRPIDTGRLIERNRRKRILWTNEKELPSAKAPEEGVTTVAPTDHSSASSVAHGSRFQPHQVR